MKSNKIIITLTIALVTNFLACAGEYPIVKNNFGPIDFQGQPVIDENGNQIHSDAPEETQMGTYLLIKNQLVELTYDKLVYPPGWLEASGWFALDPTSIYETDLEFSPRMFVSGEYNAEADTLAWQSLKVIVPQLSGFSFLARDRIGHPYQDTLLMESYKDSVDTDFEPGEIAAHYGIADSFDVQDIPGNFIEVNPARGLDYEDYVEMWETTAQNYFTLSPPLAVDLVTDDELSDEQKADKASFPEADQLTPVVQGRYEIAGAIICARREEGILTFYRFPCYQNTGTLLTTVFDPLEKLVWDVEKSNAANLATFQNLRPDLLEHNTGLTENRIFIRFQDYKIKIDRPGHTKAFRDWYILAPFYDPVTGTYRETLERSDFVANPAQNFDPQAPEFDPAVFVKKFIPYQLPEGHLESLMPPSTPETPSRP